MRGGPASVLEPFMLPGDQGSLSFAPSSSIAVELSKETFCTESRVPVTLCPDSFACSSCRVFP